MTPWQPIETAPRDGTPLLGFVPSYYQGKGGICLLIWLKNAREPDGHWYDGHAFKTDPTHWMPLPEPPKETP